MASNGSDVANGVPDVFGARLDHDFSANGVDIDDTARRLVWAAVGGRLTHHNASPETLVARLQAPHSGRKRVATTSS